MNDEVDSFCNALFMENHDLYCSVLRKYWGYDNFRPLQEEIVDAAYTGRDVLGLMPTGGGKSITFQVPALCMEGICLVVTPPDCFDERPSGQFED